MDIHSYSQMLGCYPADYHSYRTGIIILIVCMSNCYVHTLYNIISLNFCVFPMSRFHRNST